MKIKGVKRLEHCVNSFTRKFGIKASLGTDFMAYVFSNQIDFSITENLHQKNAFNDFILHLKYQLSLKNCRQYLNSTNSFMISLLHEIGHCQTDYLITDKEDSILSAKRLKIAEKCETVKAGSTEYRRLYNEYFNLKDELIATVWGLRYFDKHTKKCLRFIKKWNKEYKRFLQVNGIVD